MDKAATAAASGSKIKRKPGADLRKSLAASIMELPPVLVDHVLQANNFDTTTKLEDILSSETLMDDLFKSLAEARKTVDDITSSAVCKGYILASRKEEKSEGADQDAPSAKRENLLYDDFHPFLPQKLRDDPSIEVLEFEGYNRTVDEFFSSLEGQKLESRLTEREAAARKKIEAARQDQAKRIEGLQEAQSLNLRKAAAIEANVERVQEAMDAVNGLFDQGMDWVDIGKLVEREKKRHNPVAEIIKLPLKLSENIISLQLAEEEFEEEQDDPYETDESDADDENYGKSQEKGKEVRNELVVEINLSLSPWSNAREYYDQRKTAAAKEDRTQLQASRALKSTEKKVTEDLKKGLKQEKALLQPIRKAMWFEKFMWFISSDGYLVIGGKDAQQNEMLYRRYLRKGDVYCHADMHGASSVIIKNNPKTPDAPIPPSTLAQAGSFSVCSSVAWDSKAGMGAWWVNADQVSKSAPAGEFLPAGSFMVRGKKNFLAPSQLLLGLGIMFRISEESKAKHVKHRLHGESADTGSKQDAEKGDQDEAEKAADEDDDDIDDIEPMERASDDGYASDEEANDQAGDSPRDNPLQGFGRKEETEDLEELDDGVSKLKVDDEVDADLGEAPGLSEKPDDEEEEEEVLDSITEISEATEKPSVTATSTTSNLPQSQKGPHKRGQKAKAKKIARKYKDQDEEDRAAVEALIGATAGKKKAEAEEKAKAEREAEQAAAKERRRAQHQRQQKETAEHEEVRRLMMDEGIEMLEGEDAEKMTALDDLVGTPLAGDEIVEAIPVCAPWMALGKFKYKAKMQPGATKKGKAVKEIMERWKMESARKGVVDETARDTDKMWPREVELIKALKPEEAHNSVPVGKVRVMMAGSSGSGGGGKGGGKNQGKGGRGGRGSKKK